MKYAVFIPLSSSALAGLALISAADRGLAPAAVEGMSNFNALGRSGAHVESAIEQMGAPAAVKGMSNFKESGAHAKPAGGQIGAHVESSSHPQRVVGININSGQDGIQVESELRHMNLELGRANTEVEAFLNALEDKSRKEDIKAGLIGGTVGLIGAGTIGAVAGEDSQESVNVIQPAGSNDSDTISLGA